MNLTFTLPRKAMLMGYTRRDKYGKNKGKIEIPEKYSKVIKV